jgi:hypothetical protein
MARREKKRLLGVEPAGCQSGCGCSLQVVVRRKRGVLTSVVVGCRLPDDSMELRCCFNSLRTQLSGASSLQPWPKASIEQLRSQLAGGGDSWQPAGSAGAKPSEKIPAIGGAGDLADNFLSQGEMLRHAICRPRSAGFSKTPRRPHTPRPSRTLPYRQEG